jgi:hypothetical protein
LTSHILASFLAHRALHNRMLARTNRGSIRGELKDGDARTSDSMVDNTLFCVGGRCIGRARAAEWVFTASVCIQARRARSEPPEEKVSRHTMRPGSLGLTLNMPSLQSITRREEVRYKQASKHPSTNDQVPCRFEASLPQLSPHLASGANAYQPIHLQLPMSPRDIYVHVHAIQYPDTTHTQ